MGIWSSAFFLGQFVSPLIVHRLDLVAGSMQGAFLITGIAALAITLVALAASLRGRTPALAAR